MVVTACLKMLTRLFVDCFSRVRRECRLAKLPCWPQLPRCHCAAVTDVSLSFLQWDDNTWLVTNCHSETEMPPSMPTQLVYKLDKLLKYLATWQL